ncbi:phenylalanyl-tRNA synthetase subunit beta [Leptospira ryugenii]|uniref:Phenylalanine--tRNA ligase beta subunit n=1 Tax=Leptospira ryugenii TaxID=1917863 RepID=A0A2P2E2H8_9LEPT|nr:phenylalanine--tRNA ligase subunit beta [Leptospira ryugenii]GBF51070.1 phenylalanyl-tRNA synthetase subunit beta [Leptospira ryugenii]
MKLSINWIKDFIPLDSIPFPSVIEKINTSICEIDEVTDYQAHLTSVITVKILSSNKHPNAEKLSITQCTDGKQNYQIVTAATNINVGDIVPLALPGTKLEGKEILSSELRGVLSQGMYCSEKELGLATESSGVLIYPNHTTLGISIRSLYDWEDIILTIDNKSITHRPDLWSHFGFARELASQLNLKLRFNPLEIQETFTGGSGGIEVLSNQNAHAYFAVSITNVKVSQSSQKIKSRLSKCGIRSINNIVDVSNYILLEVGQPTHFFDRHRLKGTQFSVEFAKNSETFPLLDETNPLLTPEILLIRNSGEPVAIAGVMGGSGSAVINETIDLVLESAIFKREDIRKSIRKTGIRSESSVRYEKGLDPNTCLPVIRRAISLLKENGNPQLVCLTPQGFNHSSEKSVIIESSLSFLDSKIGKALNKTEISEILNKLGFEVNFKDQDVFTAKVPYYRHNYDVTIQEDLVEEIGRTIGYASIATKPLSLAVETPIRNPLRELERKIKFLFSTQLNFSEVYNYSFSSPKESLIEGETAEHLLAISNEMPETHSVLRMSLFPGLIRQAVSNQDRFETVDLFELGRTYHKLQKGNSLAEESRWIAFISLSQAKPNDLLSIESEFVALRQRLHELFLGLNLLQGTWEKTEKTYLHPNGALEYRYKGNTLCEFGILHTRLVDEYDLRRRAYIGKIDLLSLVNVWEDEGRISHFRAPSQFPQGQLDLSLLMDESEPTDPFLKSVSALKIQEMEEGFVQTIFRSNQIGEGKKSVTYRFKLMSYEKSFSQDRFKELSDTLVNLAKQSGYQLR